MDPFAAMNGLVHEGGSALVVLDPMAGSGSVPFFASRWGHLGIGFDVDPLALLIGRALTSPLPRVAFLQRASEVAARARTTEGTVEVATDEETAAFINFWFDRRAQDRLAALAQEIANQPERYRPALWCAFSRLIITKDVGASRARDVSHSRPHIVRSEATLDPIERFEASARVVAQRHSAARQVGTVEPGTAKIRKGDARRIPLETGSVDRVATSPPYLQAIDYLRGHRLSLVWMGHSLASLREIRSSSIGSLRGLNTTTDIEAIVREAGGGNLARRETNVLRRYVSDMHLVLGEVARVLKADGRARFVVADATLRGVSISIESIITASAAAHGLARIHRSVRPLPASQRYLPPPSAVGGALSRRMRAEQLVTFAPS